MEERISMEQRENNNDQNPIIIKVFRDKKTYWFNNNLLYYKLCL